MERKRYFVCESNGCSVVIHWHESCLIGNAIAEITGMELREIVETQRPSVLVMDFANVNGISSSVIGCLITVQRQVHRTGGQMRFARVSPTMQNIFGTMNLLGTYFDVFDSIEMATETELDRVDIDTQMRFSGCV